MYMPFRDGGKALLLFAAAIFLSAFLLFQIQPLIGKHILPWYGGAQGVWTTCLLVFQSLLFGGYAYAHALGRLGSRAQSAIHIIVLLFAAGISIVPAETWKPTGNENPIPRIVLMLLATVGLPFFALSATGPLLQAWFWRVRPDRSPYPLYALSNAGSLIALLSYPLVVEPNLAGAGQARLWRAGFGLFVVFCGAAAWLVWKTGGGAVGAPRDAGEESVAEDTRGPWKSTLLWIGWSACGVVMFMATTNQMTMDVPSVPFLWVLPLSTYLVTFILTFSGRRFYARRTFGVLLVAAMGVVYLMLGHSASSDDREFTTTILLLVGSLFVICFVSNGELYRLRPHPRRLTAFYLSIAFGGALGGVVVAVLGPLVFPLYVELQLGVLLCCVLYLATAIGDPSSLLYWRQRRWAGVTATLAVLAFAVLLVAPARLLLRESVEVRRNFFGVLRVTEMRKGYVREHSFRLLHGGIAHGHQLRHPDAQHLPTLYFAKITGIGHALSLDAPQGRRVGIVGLGTGTLATYGRPGDLFRFYEINPDVVDLARTHFTFLENSEAELQIVLGDARLNLEREPAGRFDFLILDAFNSDAIPVHLLTVEALEVYERHLKPDGVLALHVTNLYLDVESMVHRLAQVRQLAVLEVSNPDLPAQLALQATWMFLARTTEPLQRIADSLAPALASGQVAVSTATAERGSHLRAWTDDYNNLFQVLK